MLLTTKLILLPQVNEADFQPPFFTDYTMPASGQVTVPAEGGLIFNMKINGQGPFHTVFDTGAVNVISTTVAKRLGLKVEEVPVHFGAIGGAITVHTAHVTSLTIGDLIVRDQTFYVLDILRPPAHRRCWLTGSSCGASPSGLISRVTNSLSSTVPTSVISAPERLFRSSCTKDGNGVEIRAEVDGIPGIFLLDTGNQLGFFLNSSFVEEHHLVTALGARFRGYNGRGFGGPSPEAWFTRLHTLLSATLP